MRARRAVIPHLSIRPAPNNERSPGRRSRDPDNLNSRPGGCARTDGRAESTRLKPPCFHHPPSRSYATFTQVPPLLPTHSPHHHHSLWIKPIPTCHLRTEVRVVWSGDPGGLNFSRLRRAGPGVVMGSQPARPGQPAALYSCFCSLHKSHFFIISPSAVRRRGHIDPGLGWR